MRVMAKSLGGALKEGSPVVFTRKEGGKPQVVCEPGKEREALELMAKMGLIELMRPDDGRRPAGTVKPFGEGPDKDDAELLKDNGWELECESPFEIRHEDGSFADRSAARCVLQTLREEYEKDSEAGRHT
jgi:hypothetical protein